MNMPKSPLLLIATALVTTTVYANDVVYCPEINTMRNMCVSDQPYDKDTIGFPNCLFLKVKDEYVFNGDQSWTLDSFRPPSLKNAIQFVTASINESGTHCFYKSKNNSDGYVHFSLTTNETLKPYITNITKTAWKTNFSGRHHGLAQGGNSKPTGNYYTCSPKNNAILLCAFLKASSPTSAAHFHKTQ